LRQANTCISKKPVAVDVPGALKVIDMGKRAQGKLSLDVGFQIRDCPPFVEMVKRIHGGALGKIICGESHYCRGLPGPAGLGRTPRPSSAAFAIGSMTALFPATLSWNKTFT